MNFWRNKMSSASLGVKQFEKCKDFDD